MKCNCCGKNTITPVGTCMNTKCFSKETKLLFIPLFKESYLLIESGKQSCEIRPNNRRGWNCDNVYPGREIIFSNGYGRFIDKTVRQTITIQDLSSINILKWQIDAVISIYGEQDSWLVAFFE